MEGFAGSERVASSKRRRFEMRYAVRSLRYRLSSALSWSSVVTHLFLGWIYVHAFVAKNEGTNVTLSDMFEDTFVVSLDVLRNAKDSYPLDLFTV